MCDDIDCWQFKDLNDVMCCFFGVDIFCNGGMGQSVLLYVWGMEVCYVLVLIDGVLMVCSGIFNGVDISQIFILLVQWVEYICGLCFVVYGFGVIGGVVNIIIMIDVECLQINVGVGMNGYQFYDGVFNKWFGDMLVIVVGVYQIIKGFNVQLNFFYSGDSDCDGYCNKMLWGGVQYQFDDNFLGFFCGYGYFVNVDYDQGNWGYVGGNDED